jgi:ribonuclease HII
MSSRQLALVESMNNVQLTQQGLIQAVNGLRADMTRGLRMLDERLSTLQLENGVVEVVDADEEEPQVASASIVGTIPPRKQL